MHSYSTSVKVGQSFHFSTRRTNYVLASQKPPSSIEQQLTLLFFNMHYNITNCTVNLFNALASNLWKRYKHINYIVIFQPLYIVAELVALYSWLLPWLIAYFDPLFQALKCHLKVQERIFLLYYYPFFHFERLVHSCYIYTQHNTDYLTMFILCVTSVHDKFPIPLHWLYIYDRNHSVPFIIYDTTVCVIK